jgi:protein subunit release factor A
MTDMRTWTPFDPDLRIDTHQGEHVPTVTITHKPTGMQEYDQHSTSVSANTAAAMGRLRHRVTALPTPAPTPTPVRTPPIPEA